MTQEQEIPQKSQSAQIMDLWWEEKDLHILTIEGTHTVYRNAWMMSKQVDQGGEHFVQITAACPWGTMETLDDTFTRNMPAINLDATLQGLMDLSARLNALSNVPDTQVSR